MNNAPVARILTDEETKLKDGMENLVAELGTAADKRHSSRFVNNKRLSGEGNQDELNALYRTDWLSGKVVDVIPDDMTREWRSFTGDIDPDMVKKLIEEEDRLALADAFRQAHKWARLYGTAFIIISVEDGKEPHEPLDVNRLKEGSLRHIKVIDRHRMSHAETVPVQDPMNANFGMPEFYRINETTVKIHHSRVIRFDGVLLPFDEFRRNNYYSDSVLDRLYESITNLNTVTDGAASMVYETNVDIMKVKGLMTYLQTADGEALLRKRFALAGVMKSFNNMLLLDTEETYENKTNTFAGLPDLIDRYSGLLSGASDIPRTRLFGDSASGLNATGIGDLKNYYDKLRSDQKKDYKPKLDVFDNIMAKHLGIGDDADLSYEFNSLFQMTPKEIADANLVDAQRDAIYLDRDIVTESTIAKELKQKSTYTNITDDHIEELEELEELEDLEDEPDTDINNPEIKEEKEKSNGGEDT